VSIAVMTEVWRRSQHSGSSLLMMLALADFSDDNGSSYPAVSTLATKCRMKPRNANVVLAALRDSGELHVLMNAGPNGVNRYRIMLKALGGLQGNAGVQGFAGLQGNAGAASGDTLQGNAGTPAIQGRLPLQANADKPSLNRQEPSGRRKPAKTPPCPFVEIVSAYHQILPEMPAVRILDSGDRKAKTATFWAWVLTSTRADGTRRATNEVDALAWIQNYFERARMNDFLMGRTERRAEHKNWRADFDYLLTESGRKQVIEKTEVAA
jgi:hypothetical protein